MDDLTETIAGLRRLHAAATPGKWERYNYIGYSGGLRLLRSWQESQNGGPHRHLVSIGDCIFHPDAHFIAAAHNALPALLDRIAELEVENAKLRSDLTIERGRVEGMKMGLGK